MTYQPSPIGPATAVPVPETPAGPPARPVTPTPSPYAPSQLDIIAHTETGNQNIVQRIHDVNTDRGTPANGVFQFIDPTWRRQAVKAGVDINRYPTAISAPPDIQAKVAAITPIREWGPNTVAALRRFYPNLDTSKPPTGPYNGSAVSVPASTSGAPAAAPASSTANIGLALAALNQPGSSGRSTMDNMQSMFPQSGGDSGGAQPANQGLQQQFAAAPGNARSQQIAQQAQPMMAALQKQAMQPLTGVQQPPQGMVYMGGQAIPMPGRVPTPGTTLNSMGEQ